MGCSTCKSNKKIVAEEVKGNNDTNNNLNTKKDTINLLDNENILKNSFLFRLVSFVVVLIALPFLNLVLLWMVFVNLFIPKKDAMSIVNGAIDGVAKKYANYRYKREMKKKIKQFSENRGYDINDELLDIEVFTNKGDNKTEESE